VHPRAVYHGLVPPVAQDLYKQTLRTN
jgi:hypothetical protein